LKTLNDWLTYFQTLPSKPPEFRMDDIKVVAEKLELLEFPCPVLTIAGTNGKGSCVATLESILLNAGYKVGTNTSPHLLKYNERIKVNGESISDEDLVNAFQYIDDSKGDIDLSFFEYTTLAALHTFKETELDFILLEIGLGGRNDAVNIVNPDISIVTSIALDHVQILGEDRDTIAREKAGIFRPGKPAICGDMQAPQSLISYAETINAPLYLHGKDFSYKANGKTWDWQGKKENLSGLPKPIIKLQNASTALQAIELISKDYPIDHKAIQKGLKAINLQGRFQHFPGPVDCYLDVAHNTSAAEHLAALLDSKPCKGKTIAVVGMLIDKDIDGTIEAVRHNIDEWHLASLEVPRGAEVGVLVDTLAKKGIVNVKKYDTVEDAYEQAMSEAKKGDRVVAFGSFYTVAKVLRLRL